MRVVSQNVGFIVLKISRKLIADGGINPLIFSLLKENFKNHTESLLVVISCYFYHPIRKLGSLKT